MSKHSNRYRCMTTFRMNAQRRAEEEEEIHVGRVHALNIHPALRLDELPSSPPEPEESSVAKSDSGMSSRRPMASAGLRPRREEAKGSCPAFAALNDLDARPFSRRARASAASAFRRFAMRRSSSLRRCHLERRSSSSFEGEPTPGSLPALPPPPPPLSLATSEVTDDDDAPPPPVAAADAVVEVDRAAAEPERCRDAFAFSGLASAGAGPPLPLPAAAAGPAVGPAVAPAATADAPPALGSPGADLLWRSARRSCSRSATRVLIPRPKRAFTSVASSPPPRPLPPPPLPPLSPLSPVGPGFPSSPPTRWAAETMEDNAEEGPLALALASTTALPVPVPAPLPGCVGAAVLAEEEEGAELEDCGCDADAAADADDGGDESAAVARYLEAAEEAFPFEPPVPIAKTTTLPL